MSTQPTLNSIATDVVGHYSHAAKNLLAAYRTGAQRVGGRFSGRYSDFVVGNVVRISERADQAVDKVSARTLEGITTLSDQTAWAKDLMIVNALRTVNLPAAKLSQRIAAQVDDVSRRLSERVAGAKLPQAARTAVRAAKAVPARRAAKPARRAASKR